MRKPLIAALSVLALAACAGSKEPIAKQYFVLGLDDPPMSGARPLARPGIAIGRVRLASHLNEQGIAMMLEGNRINIAAHSLWGEPLDRTIPQILAKDIAAACQCLVDRSGSGQSKKDDGFALGLQIDRFGPTDEGRVILTGEYRLHGPDGADQTEAFYLTRDLAEDGYPEAVRAMRSLLKDLASHIASDRAAQI